MSEESAVKLKPFSGKEDEWVYWAPMFLARADAKGYRGIAEGEDEVPNDDEVLDPRTESHKIKLKQLNKTGYSELMALMSRAKVAFMLVRKSRTAGLPNGSLFEAWKNLKARYEPIDVETVQDVIDKYNDCKLEDNEDPEEWITRKDELRLRLQIDFGKKDYEDADFKAAIVHSLPEAYHAEKILLKDKYRHMHIQDIITMLRNRFKELNVESKEEKAMAARENNQSRIICWHCGQYGHKRQSCRNKDDGKPDVIKPRSGNRGGGGYKGICSYCNKRGHHENDCFKRKSDNERAHAAEEEEDDDSSGSEEHVMMAYEPYDCFADDSDVEYIDFEAEQELFKLFNPRPRAANPSTSMEPKPYTNPSTNPNPKMKGEEEEYVPFKLFDENGNRNYDSDDESECDFEDEEADDEESINSEGLEVPDLIEYESEIDSDSDDDNEVEVKLEPKKYECDDHCSKWMRGHQKSKCEFANHLMSDESGDEEFEDTAGVDPEGATAESESEPEPEEAYRAVNSTGHQGLLKPRKMSDRDLFIADTGATCHIKTDSTGLTNLRKVNKTVRMGQSSVKILFQGDYECKAHQTDGTVQKVVLKDVRVAPVQAAIY